MKSQRFANLLQAFSQQCCLRSSVIGAHTGWLRHQQQPRTVEQHGPTVSRSLHVPERQSLPLPEPMTRKNEATTKKWIAFAPRCEYSRTDMKIAPQTGPGQRP